MAALVVWTTAASAQEPREGAWQAEVTTGAIEPVALDRRPATPFNATVVSLLDDPQSLPLPVRQRADALRGYYSSPTAQRLWSNEARASGFVARVQNAAADGLSSTGYPLGWLQQVRQPNRLALTREAQLRHEALAELSWSAFFLKYASELKVGRLLPSKVDTKLYWQKKDIDMAAALDLASAFGSMDEFFSAWEPQIADYQGLKIALGVYRQVQASGGWPEVPVDEKLIKPGETASNIPQLRLRLAVSDGAPPAAPAGQAEIYSDDLVAALKRFQRRHGLEDDGVIGKNTYFQLNIPVETRIRQIILSMERWRWMPEELGSDYVMVNIAGFQLRRARGGRVVERMRVVVGKPYHQTPVFSDKMEYVEINPYWNVPRSILVNEELSKLQSNPSALAARGFEALDGDRAIPVTAINWSGYSASNMPFRLRQRPGPNNALGRVKFMFPNQFNVYMHDTPAQSLFGDASRAYSHGCVRLERPIDFAEQVLGMLPGWDRARIEQVLASGERTVVSLKEHIAVHLTYSTAWLGEDGDVEFRSDIYNRDAKLYAALFGKAYAY